MLKTLLTSAALSLMAMSAQAATVSALDVIPDGDRDYFNGFEGMGSGGAGVSTYTEDNIKVTQVNPGYGIWNTYNPGGMEGAKSWYPNGGDNGYTSISLADGGDFDAIGMLIGSGNSSHDSIWYSLRLDGAEVASGTFAHTRAFTYIGFSDGVFDEIWIRDGSTTRTSSVTDGTHNALAIDSIEVSAADVAPVPLPATLPFLLVGIGGFAVLRRRKG